MQDNGKVTNVIIAGLGGQGVLKASNIMVTAAFNAGFDVKKSEIHGMSQRGGSVTSDVRFGKKVYSPMVSPGQADLLLVLAADQVEVNRHSLRLGGVLITPGAIDETQLANKRSLNIAILGVLSRHVPIAAEHWIAAIKSNFDAKLIDANLQAFELGRQTK
jgi:indolepyruvate ferredoxin oxidoreductase beta subunit